MKKKVAIITSIVLAALIGLAVAGGHHWYGGRSAEDRAEFVKNRISRTLELDETQRATLDRMADDLLAERDRMKAQRNEFRQRFFDVLNQEQVAAEDLVLLFEEKKPQIDRWMQLAADNIAEFHAILTPQQRERLITEIRNHHEKGCRFARWSSPEQVIEEK